VKTAIDRLADLLVQAGTTIRRRVLGVCSVADDRFSPRPHPRPANVITSSMGRTIPIWIKWFGQGLPLQRACQRPQRAIDYSDDCLPIGVQYNFDPCSKIRHAFDWPPRWSASLGGLSRRTDYLVMPLIGTAAPAALRRTTTNIRQPCWRGRHRPFENGRKKCNRSRERQHS
jgi:hypothetical protein